jgi:hypothetical protein
MQLFQPMVFFLPPLAIGLPALLASQERILRCCLVGSDQYHDVLGAQLRLDVQVNVKDQIVAAISRIVPIGPFIRAFRFVYW